MEHVFLKQFKVKTYIGVFAWEKRIHQALILNLQVEWPNHLAAKNDDLTLALDYSEVADIVLVFCENNQFELIETLGEQLCELLLNRYQAKQIKLSIDKPCAIQEATVGIELTRVRN